MNTLLIIGICLIIYGLSMYITASFIRKAHSNGGRWFGLPTTKGDVLTVVLPLINTFYALIYFFDSPYKNKKNYDNLFKITK